MDLGFRVQEFRLRAQGLGCRVQGSGLKVQVEGLGLGFVRVQTKLKLLITVGGFRVPGSGFSVQ